jgi:pimeloyl-ACP methyl ester carboxylesterase
MTQPFFRGFHRTDFIFLATVAQALAADDYPGLQNAFAALGPGVVSRRPGSVLIPESYLYISDTLIVLLIQGTEGVGQWAGQILASFQVPYQFGGPNVTGFDLVAATAIYNDVDPVIRPRLVDHQLVLMGHSLGGALAQVIAYWYRIAATLGMAVLTMGAPRVGDPDFAAAVGPFVSRLEAANDPIPTIPPESWSAIGSAFPVQGINPPQTYQHAGAAATLVQGGDIVPGQQLISLPETVAQLVTGAAPTHQTSWYLDQLLLQSDLRFLSPGGEGYPDPAALYEQTRSQQGVPISGRPNLEGEQLMSQLVQGLLYFRDTGISEGWSEAVYAIGSIPSMNALLNSLITPRAQFLGTDMQIHAIRSSYVGSPKLSQTTKFASPQVGQGSGPSNTPQDAILYNYKSAVNARRILTFRGVPDTWVSAGVLTALGIAGLGSIDSYCQALLAAVVGIKIPDPSVLVQDIVSIGNTVPGGIIVVTSALAHGLTTGDTVNIAGMRGYPYLLGRWKINVLSATTFSLNGSARYNIQLNGVGTFQGVEYILQSPSTFGFNMVAVRKTGRPFGQPRGKRSKRLLRS